MNDPVYDNLPLIAQNDEHHGGGDTQEQGHQADTTEGQQAGHPKGEDNAFQTLLAKLGDHREIEIGPLHILDLPVMLIDDGFHFYSSVEAMEADGAYHVNHETHKIQKHDGTAPALDISITSVVAYQWLAMVILLGIFIPMARKYRKLGARSQKGLFNAMEAMVEYVRNNVILPNVGVGKVGRSLAPILLTYFFFILTMNLTGLVPGGHSATGSLSVTAGLAAIAFFVIQYAAIRENGLWAWVKHLTGGTPKMLWPIMIPVEVMGLFAKPFALCIRLFANMTGGHVVLTSLIGLVFVSAVFIPVTVAFSAFINLLELLVAFIQAYIFTILVGLFSSMGMQSHDHGHEDEKGAHVVAH